MSLSRIIAVLILCSSSLVFADPGNGAGSDKEKNERNWTILAAEKHADKAAENPKFAAPGVFVTAQRDPQDKK
jgi:hypothetical protein